MTYPFLSTVMLTDRGGLWECQMKSPFYFIADSSTASRKKVFLKVWKVDDADIDSVLSEWMHHRHAFKEGVPVAAPALDEIATSTCSNGEVYLVFAVEYIRVDNIQCEKDFLEYCKSLIETVLKLHKKAGLLHGDLKPRNVCWSDGVVRLIDFGNAQKISSAVWSRGTKGFEAPEILNKEPCSTKTDAYSVGATILKVFKQGLTNEIQQNPNCRTLHDIALELTKSDPDKRWSLTEALYQIQKINENQGPQPSR